VQASLGSVRVERFKPELRTPMCYARLTGDCGVQNQLVSYRIPGTLLTGFELIIATIQTLPMSVLTVAIATSKL
jgi:hypothetical protein